MADRLIGVIKFLPLLKILMIKYSQIAIFWYNLLVWVLYTVEFSNYNGISTGLVHYHFLSFIFCKPYTRQAGQLDRLSYWPDLNRKTSNNEDIITNTLTLQSVGYIWTFKIDNVYDFGNIMERHLMWKNVMLFKATTFY